MALLKFDRPLFQKDWNWNTTNKNAIYPICLPDDSYDEIGKIGRHLNIISSILHLKFVPGFVTGYGLESQNTCRTNGKGPKIYSTCAPGSIFSEKGKNETERHYKEDSDGRKVWEPGCITSTTPSKLDSPCVGFNHHYKKQVPKLSSILK